MRKTLTEYRSYLVKNYLTKTKAITLLELMVSLGIFAIIIALASSITGRGRMSWTESSARIFVHSQARIVSTEISRELMSSNPSRIFLSDNDGDGNNDRIQFSIPLVDDQTGNLKRTGNGDLQWGDGSIQGNSINYICTDQDLLRQILDSDSDVKGERRAAQNVSGFTVIRNNPQYEITLSFYIDNYLGTALSEPIDYTVIIAVTPKN